MAGAEIANRAAQSMPGQEVFVRIDNGVLVEVTQPVVPGLRVGQRVFIQGNGHQARVVPQQSSDATPAESSGGRAPHRATDR